MKSTYTEKGKPEMTAFDLFQRATCEIMEGNREAAFKTINRAIKKIDNDGVDVNVRGDLVMLRAALVESP